MPLTLGKNYTVYFAKGEGKTLCKFNFCGKLHDFKEISFGEAALYRPLL
jgi:hypothetical protein